MPFILHRYRWEREDIPVSLLKYMANEVILMETLHDDDDDVFFLVVETALDRIVEPVVDILSARLRQGIVGLEGVINEDHVTAASRHRATHRSCQSAALPGGHEVFDRPLLERQS